MAQAPIQKIKKFDKCFIFRPVMSLRCCICTEGHVKGLRGVDLECFCSSSYSAPFLWGHSLLQYTDYCGTSTFAA